MDLILSILFKCKGKMLHLCYGQRWEYLCDVSMRQADQRAALTLQLRLNLCTSVCASSCVSLVWHVLVWLALPEEQAVRTEVAPGQRVLIKPTTIKQSARNRINQQSVDLARLRYCLWCVDCAGARATHPSSLMDQQLCVV